MIHNRPFDIIEIVKKRVACMKNRLLRILMIIIFFVLLLTPEISIASARAGLVLWANVVVPSLLPSMIMATLLVQIQATSLISRLVHPLLAPIYGVSEEGSFCMISGILCGYPMGVKVANDLLSENRISVREARQLLGICAYPSPMFLIGYVVNNRLASPQLLPLYLAATYLPSIPISLVMRLIHPCQIQEKPKTSRSPVSIRFQMLEDCVVSSCEIMIKIGAFMMLFSILTGWISNIHLLPRMCRLLFSLVLEMTTGVNSAAQSDLPQELRTAACLFATSFGGLCTLAQTGLVLKDSRLHLYSYMLLKLLHGILSVVCFFLLSRFLV
jgi:sporulation integral membrane protein YlbJ